MAVRVERRLAAILATDVAGYSRLMERDEMGTLARLKAHRKELVEPLLAEYRGRVVKLMGDGALVEFASVVDAVACAVAIQRGMAEREAGRAEEESIRFRIGINLGDVVCEGDGDLYGDGVNVAARLEQAAEPGGIVLSGTAADHLQGKLDCGLVPLGELRLKNIGRPVRAYRVELGASTSATEAKAVPLPPDKPAVAVLPFDNLSDDLAQAYFSDGITEDIITELSRFRELLVIARNSSFAYRGKAMDVREIGRALGAGYVVEGSVRRAGERVRITAQLIDAATGAHLWAERWDRPLGDVFAVQDEIARGVVATVAARVLEEGEAAARRRPPQDVRAYDLFLQGRRLSDMFTSGAQEQTRGLFERARRHLDLARAMNPNDAEIQITWAWAQACLGEPERGLPAAELAMRLNPRYYEHYRSRILFLGRRHAEAAAVLERITADAPLEHPRDLAWWAAACALLGRTEEARRYGELFVAAVRQTWRGDPTACPAEYVDWLVDVSYLQRPEDAAHLREGLRLAGLMA